MRREPTEAERRMWSMLRNRRLAEFKFRRQAKLGRFIVDFVCMECKLVIEIDGSQHAANQYDQRRDHWLKDRGFKVLRFWNNEVLTNPTRPASNMRSRGAWDCDGRRDRGRSPLPQG
jgi:very-short-patch-repair endonuclease